MYCLDAVPIKIKKTRAIRPQYKGLRSLTQVSQQIRVESLPLYLENQFQHTYCTAASLKKFLRSPILALAKNRKSRLLIVFKHSCSALDFLPIFKTIAATYLKGLEVSFQCEDWNSTTAGIMNRAIQQKSLWHGSPSPVERIACYGNRDTSPTVHLRHGPCWSQQDSDERIKASKVWRSLGIAVPYYDSP